ncbi:DUF2141 domain-containing protein [soil metagenome]
MKKALNFAAAALLLWSATAQAAELELTVQNLASGQGAVLVAVFNEEGQWLKAPVAVAKQPASTQVDGKLTLLLKDLPEGELAISVFHDLNDNGRLDLNGMGIPLEPFAFSNEAKAMFSAPKFQAARFSVPAVARMTITLN